MAEQPLVSTHFSEKQCIHPSVVAPVTTLMPTTLIPTPALVPVQSPTTNPQGLLLQLSLTNPTLAQLSLQQPQLPQQQQLQLQLFLQPLSIQPQLALAPIPSVIPLPTAAGISTCPGLTSAPPSPIKLIHLPQPVSCHDFCDRYEISPGDEAKLDKLEFIPGDRGIKRLGQQDWQGDVGFTKLEWDHILWKHKEFLADVSRGLWDVDPFTI